MRQIKSVPRFGDVGWDVVAIQEALFDHFPKIYIDGIFGRETQECLAEFQKKMQIENQYPGTIGPMTLKKLGFEVVSVSPVSGKRTVTKDLKGKKDRHLHPNLRLALEGNLFPEGRVLPCFQVKNLQQCRIALDNVLGGLGITESAKNNFGTKVGWVQGVTGTYTEGGNGDDWCVDYGQIPIAFMEDYFQIESPVAPSAHTITTFNEAKKVPGLIAPDFEIGTLWIARRSPVSGHAGGVVAELAWDLMRTNEGNVDGTSGFYTRHKELNSDLQTLGFVRVYPGNSLKF